MRRVLLACIAVATGCTLLTPLDGLSGGPLPDDAGPDAATADAPLVDVGADTPVDGGVDAQPDVGVGCASLGSHTVCDDFDRPDGPFPSGWAFKAPPGTVAPDTTMFVSPPRAAVLTVPGASPTCSYAEMDRELVGSYHRAKVGLSVRLGVADPKAVAGLGNVLYVGVARRCAVNLQPGSPTPNIYIENDPTGTPGQSSDMSLGVTRGAWARVNVVFDTAASPYVVVDIDGKNALTLTSLADVCKAAGSVIVGVGPHCVKGADTIEARVDDVTIDVE